MNFGSDKWDERYGVNEFIYGKEPNLFLRQNTDVIPKGKVLCLADGEGRNGVWLTQKGYDVTSIDFSSQAIEKSKRLANDNNITINYICADILNYDFGTEQYEGIVSIFSHFKINDMNILHQKYYDALKPNGIFLMEAFAREQLPLDTGGPKDIRLLYNIDEVKKSFPVGDIELLRKDIVYLHEGELHDGKAIVVRAVIRKSSK